MTEDLSIFVSKVVPPDHEGSPMSTGKCFRLYEIVSVALGIRKHANARKGKGWVLTNILCREFWDAVRQGWRHRERNVRASKQDLVVLELRIFGGAHLFREDNTPGISEYPQSFGLGPAFV